MHIGTAGTPHQSALQTVAEACQPFQFALSTRAGTEAPAHALQAATEADPDATILSVDGVGAFDTVSRLAMLRGLSRVPGASACLPFVRQFYTAPSRFVWHDAAGRPRAIDQAEGGEQGNPLMPALYALGQHPALVELQRRLRPGELVFAYLDDIYVIGPSARARVVFDLLSQHLFRHARIEVHQGKTRAWNAAGLEPPGIRELGSTDAPVWVGDPALPPEQQGLVALGVPCGHPAYVATQLQATRAKQDSLLQGILSLPDLQSAWLLLLFCASPRCCHLLRSLPPVASLAFAEAHDAAVAACLADLLGAGPLPDHALRLAQLPFQQGGLNLRSAVALAPAAYWASWADTLPVLHRQLPRFAADVVARLGAGEPVGPTLRGVLQSQAALAAAGFDLPTWDAVILGAQACLPSPGLSNLDGPGPDISDLLAGARDAPDVSRLPAR